MSIDALKGQPEKDLVGKLNQLAQENFKASFTTEPMTPARGTEIRKRRREAARVHTVLRGREALKCAQAEQTRLEGEIKKLGAPHEGDAQQKNKRRKLQRSLEQAKRTVRELGSLAEGK